MLDCLQREPDRLRATALFYPKDPNAPQKLTALVQQEPHIVALRFHAHRGKEFYLDSFQDENVRTLWKTAGELGLLIELHIGPNYAAQAGAVIRTYPDFPVLIDHLGEPTMGNAVEYADVLALAQFDNVYMKLSGLDYIAKDGPLYPARGPSRVGWWTPLVPIIWCGVGARRGLSMHIWRSGRRQSGLRSKEEIWRGFCNGCRMLQ